MWSMFQNQKLPKSGRFAPTPTGQLHIGNAYSALLSLITAKAHGCNCILRIDDLDKRSLPKGCLEGQLQDLEWLGLSFDEGLAEGGSRGPYRQSDRSDLYESALVYLNQQGLLYPCYCSRKEIAAVAPHAQDEGFVYPGTCRPLNRASLDLEHIRTQAVNGRYPALRFNTQTFKFSEHCNANTIDVNHRVMSYHDLVYGRQTAHLDEAVGDFVIQRKDGVYAYQLACAVDDYLFNCAYVVRGADLITSTHRQRLILAALNLPLNQIPRYAHVGLVVDHLGDRLAKRNESIQLKGLRESGVQPHALRASLSRILGGPDSDDIDQMASAFSWSQVPSQEVKWSLHT
jgi:glutamyl-tRNA synthetase